MNNINKHGLFTNLFLFSSVIARPRPTFNVHEHEHKKRHGVLEHQRTESEPDQINRSNILITELILTEAGNVCK
jgi:hypothetical protein